MAGDGSTDSFGGNEFRVVLYKPSPFLLDFLFNKQDTSSDIYIYTYTYPPALRFMFS